MTVLEVVLVSVLGVVAMIGAVGMFLSNLAKDAAIERCNKALAAMATRFATQLSIEDGDQLAFAEMTDGRAEEVERRPSRADIRRHNHLLRVRDRLDADDLMPMSEADTIG